MISLLFQKRFSIWTIVWIALVSPVGDIRGEDSIEVIDIMYGSPLFTTSTPSQEDNIESEYFKELLSKVSHLSLPPRVKMLLAFEHQNGAFKHIELGGIYNRPQKYLIVLLLFLFFVGGIAGFLEEPLNEVIFQILFLSTFASMMAILLYLNYQDYIYPRYLFCTDTGILIVEKGGIEEISWLYYKDIQFLKDCLTITGFAGFKRVLRTIDKMKQVHEFDSDMIDPVLYDKMVAFLVEKVGNT